MDRIFTAANMGGRPLTGLAPGANPSDAVRFDQVGVPFSSGRFKSGFYSLIGSTGTGTNNSNGNGSLRLYAFACGQTVALSRMGAEITSAGDAGSTLRLGIYADDGFGMPGALVLDAGTIAGDSATVQEVTISVTLSPGIYWVGGAVQGVTTTQPTVRVVQTPLLPVSVAGSSIPSAAAGVVGANIGSVTGALPPSVAPSALNSGSAPRVFFKAA